MTDPPASMTYGGYLALDQLLSAQHPVSSHHDEMLFIIIHQAKELWLKQTIHELHLALDLIRREWGYMLNVPIGTASTFWEGFKDDGSFAYESTGPGYTRASLPRAGPAASRWPSS